MIGVDIGGTNLLVGIVEQDEVITRSHHLIEDRSFSSVVDLTCDAILDLYGPAPDSVGIAVAGGVDAKHGIVVRAQNLNWDQAPLAKEVSEKLEITPAKIYVKRIIRKKYAPVKNNSKNNKFKTLSMPAELLPKSIAGASLIAYIITAKYADALPLYRQEQIFKRLFRERSI